MNPTLTAGFELGSSLLGAFSGKGKKSGTAASRAVEKLLGTAAKKVLNYDPYADITNAIDQAQVDAGRLSEKSLSNVFAKYANTEGSAGYLPDTARSSVLRGVMSDTSNSLATLSANLRLSAMEKWVNLARGVITSATAGRGEVLQSNNNWDPMSLVNAFKNLAGTVKW